MVLFCQKAQIFFFNDYWVVVEQGGLLLYKANPSNFWGVGNVIHDLKQLHAVCATIFFVIFILVL